MIKMSQKELEEAERKHKLWLENKPDAEKAVFADRSLKNKNLSKAVLAEADLQHSQWNACNFSSCDLSGADLRSAILCDCELYGCNLEKSDMRNIFMDRCSWPLWRGSLKAYVDDTTVLQLLYHTLSLAQHSPYVSESLKSVILDEKTVYVANQYYRAEEYGYIEAFESKKEMEMPVCD